MVEPVHQECGRPIDDHSAVGTKAMSCPRRGDVPTLGDLPRKVEQCPSCPHPFESFGKHQAYRMPMRISGRTEYVLVMDCLSRGAAA